MSRLAIALIALATLTPLAASAQGSGDGLPLDIRTRDGRKPTYAGSLGGIGAGVTLAGVARGAIKGDADAVSDALGEPLTPEFLIGIAMFDASFRGAGALLNRVPVEGRVATAVKGNLALAAAITIASAVDIDLNGFTYGDLARGDLEKLAEASVGLRPVDAEAVGTSVVVYGGAGLAWTGVKRGAGMFGRIVAKRFLTTAALKAGLAVAPVPGSRVAALLLTAGDIALAAVDLAVVITAGGLVDEQVQQIRAEQKAESAIEEARRNLEQAALTGDAQAFADALPQTAGAYDEERNRHYQGLALDDLALVRRMRHDGADGKQLDQLARGVFEDYGTRLALPAQTAALIETYGQEHEAHVERQQERAKRAATERTRDYDAEAAFYRQLREKTTDLELREQLKRAAEEVEALKTLEQGLFARIAKPSFPNQVETARTSLSQALDTTTKADWEE